MLALVLWLGQTKAEEVVEDDMVIVEGMAKIFVSLIRPIRLKLGLQGQFGPKCPFV